GTFGPEQVYGIGGWVLRADVSDFNGDGNPDLIVGAVAARDAGVSMLFGNGDGTFHNPVALSIAPDWLAGIADFNGAGKADLLLGNNSGISVALGRGDGSFQSPIGQVVFGPYLAAMGDFNRDGKPDVALSDGAHTIAVLLGRGDGTFEAVNHVT